MTVHRTRVRTDTRQAPPSKKLALRFLGRTAARLGRDNLSDAIEYARWLLEMQRDGRYASGGIRSRNGRRSRRAK